MSELYRFMTAGSIAIALGLGAFTVLPGCEDDWGDNDVEDVGDDVKDGLEDAGENLEEAGEDLGREVEDAFD